MEIEGPFEKLTVFFFLLACFPVDVLILLVKLKLSKLLGGRPGLLKLMESQKRGVVDFSRVFWYLLPSWVFFFVCK